jgi:hypothetical protein
VRVDRALRKAEALGDLGVRKARRHQRDDLPLTMHKGPAGEALAKWTPDRHLLERDRPH